MSIKLILSSNLTYLAKGKNVSEVDGETVGECLNHLVSLVPVMKKTSFMSQGTGCIRTLGSRLTRRAPMQKVWRRK
jgi:hypothetical protein